jgi:hypothetical protein
VQRAFVPPLKNSATVQRGEALSNLQERDDVLVNVEWRERCATRKNILSFDVQYWPNLVGRVTCTLRVPSKSYRTRDLCLGNTYGRDTIHHAAPLLDHASFYHVFDACQGRSELHKERWNRCSPRHILRIPTPIISERDFDGHILLKYWTLRLACYETVVDDLKAKVLTPWRLLVPVLGAWGSLTAQVL